MGELVMAAKITHVPSIWMSEKTEGLKGIRDFAIAGLNEIGRRAQERGVDTFVICDTHWLVNQGFHISGRKEIKGIFASNELPHMLHDMEYDYTGDPELGHLIAAQANEDGIKTICHDLEGLNAEYGTLIPMRHANKFGAKVLSLSANQFSTPEENANFGKSLLKAIEKSDRKVAFLASGSLSHAFAPSAISQGYLNNITDEFYRQVDLRVLQMWQQGLMQEFIEMLPLYAKLCCGEAAMADTGMVLGLLGWKDYQGKGEVICDYFPSSGTGQCIVEFSLPLK